MTTYEEKNRDLPTSPTSHRRREVGRPLYGASHLPLVSSTASCKLPQAGLGSRSSENNSERRGSQPI